MSKENKPRSKSAAHKERSASKGVKISSHKVSKHPQAKQRSMSKGSDHARSVKMPIKIIEKAVYK